MNIGDAVIDFLLKNAPYEEARFQEDTLKHLQPEVRQYLLDSGLLVKTGELASYVYEYGEPVKVQVVHGSCPPKFFIFDGDDIVYVPVSRVELYAIDYGVLASIVQRDFATKNAASVLLPGRVWFCGNTGSQQREVFLVRNGGVDANVMVSLERQPQRSIVLQIGLVDEKIVQLFTEAQVCQIRDILAWCDNGLWFDKNVINARITALQKDEDDAVHVGGKEYQNGKKNVQGLLVHYFELLLVDARQRANDERGQNFPIIRVRKKKKIVEYRLARDQATLAQAAHISTAMMTRIKQEWERRQLVDTTYPTYLALMEFIFKQKFDIDSVFDFHDQWKQELRAVGLDEGF